MAVAKMKYLNVYGPEKALMHTLAVIAHCGSFAPEGGEAIHSAIRYGQNRYEPLLTKAKGLLKDLGHSSLAGEYTGDENAYTLSGAAEYLEKFAAEVARRSQRKTAVESELEIQLKTEGLLSHMTDLDINIDDLFTVETLKVRVGRLPKESYVRLAYYADKGFNFTSYFNFIVYDFDGEFYWGLYFAPADSAKDIDDIFASLYFERIWVPEFVHGKPGEALEAIREREAELREELAGILGTAGIATEEELAKIRDVTAWLAMMDQLYEMKKFALVFSHTFYISGFVPEDEYPAFESLVDSIGQVKIKEAAQKQEVPAKPPVKLKNRWFSRPYQLYTEMYGLPGYTDLDPTSIVAWIYSVLFGLMFADLGQGLVLGLFGYFYMYKRRGLAIGHILARASIFCCLFGFLFGSVFGLETALDPVFHAMGFASKPFEVMHEINTLLLVSVGVGVLVVALAIVAGIISKFQRRNPGEAIVSPNGIAGLVFYLALVALLVDSMMLKTGIAGGALYIVCLIIVPLVVMYLQEPLAQFINTGKIHVESLSDILLGGFFEMFVGMLEYLANTVSFLRVGGFVLAHTGMMSVVLTLAEMAGGAGYVFIMVVGNIFVICLEGLLVGIQALRLNYYELFSRFYEADGEPFQPLRILPDTVEL